MANYAIETRLGPKSAQRVAEWMREHMDYPNDQDYPEELDALVLSLEAIAGKRFDRGQLPEGA